MTLTRRALAASTLALPFIAEMAQAAPKKPIVIAHRGASGERPEHTELAYRLAVEQGADFIEPDLVVSKDGHLVVRHENEIGGTTDVESRPEFASRKTTKRIDGQEMTGWFAEDFTLAELKSLRARERLPQLRPASAKFDGQTQILTFQEVVALARAESARVGRVIGVYPEMKHPTFLASIGLPIEDRMAAALRETGLDSPTAPVFVQCFEVAPLKTIRRRTNARLVQLVSSEGGPADAPSTTYAQMLTPDGLKTIASYASGLGPEKTLVIPQNEETLLPATSLVNDAHAAGLVVHPWTVRAENYFLPKSLKKGMAIRPDYPRLQGDVIPVLKALYAAGVDGVFSDFPGLAVQARDA